MNIVYLSPHFPPNYYLFCVNLKKLGANLLGVADVPYEKLQPELKWALDDYFQVKSLEDYQQILKACGYFTYKYGKLDRIDSLNEHWLELEAKIRTDFNIFGIKAEQINDIRSKEKMKQRFIEAKIPVVSGKAVQKLSQAKKFLKKVNTPIVAKPVIGVGASHTYKIHNVKELEDFWQNKQPVDYFLEEFIEGAIYSYDGLTDRSGKPVFYSVHRNFDGVMELVNEDLHTAYYSLREIPSDIEKLGTKIIKKFNIYERFFHIEFFRTKKDGKLIALEINIRPPGGFTTDMFNYANNIDIYYQWANVVLFDRFDAEYNWPYHCIYVSRKWNRDYQYSHEEIMEKFSTQIVFNKEINPIFSRAMGNYCYLARSPELEEIFAIKDFIHA